MQWSPNFKKTAVLDFRSRGQSIRKVAQTKKFLGTGVNSIAVEVGGTGGRGPGS